MEALKATNLLYTAAEIKFNIITQLALDVCETKVAAISLVAEDKIWVKSSIGMGAEEIPRDLAFCSHTILRPGILEVQDALGDERFYNNPFVVEDPHLRFYAGAPIIWEGAPLGALCVIDKQPRRLSEGQKFYLETLAGHVAQVITLRKKMHRLQDELRQLESEKNSLKGQRMELIDSVKKIKKTYFYDRIQSKDA